jgi:UDP-N-acetylmuramate: L-alanyl-gamma-D-glutamyl-meso-diaminopimelate ligase
MKLGVHNETLARSLDDANLVCIYRPHDFPAEFDQALGSLGSRLRLYDDYDDLVAGMAGKLLAGDQVVFMSNGGFGAARQKLTMILQKDREAISQESG